MAARESMIWKQEKRAFLPESTKAKKIDHVRSSVNPIDHGYGTQRPKSSITFTPKVRAD